MTKDEALKSALEALEEVVKWYQVRDKNDEPLPVHNQNPEIKASIEAITAIKALAESEQEPVAWAVYEADGTHHNKPCQYPKCSYPCPDLPDCRDAQPEQEPNKDGSPCPEFWDWLPKAYNFDGNGAFTKYNMEVAFLAGKQTSQPAQQEPVAWMNKHGACMSALFKEVDATAGEYTIPLYTTPPQRTWVGLESEEIRKAKHHIIDGAYHYSFKQGAEWAEAKLKEKNGG